MKSLIFILLSCFVALCLLGFVFVHHMETEKKASLMQKEINALRKINKQERDSLENVLKLKSDSFDIAKRTILLQDSLIKRKETSITKKTERHEKIVFVDLNDSTRHRKLSELYPSYKNP